MSEDAAGWRDETSDADLLTAARGGDDRAIEALHQRHADAARAVARQYTRSADDAETLVADALAAVDGAVRAGGGPDVGYRMYLFAHLRRLAGDPETGPGGGVGAGTVPPPASAAHDALPLAAAPVGSVLVDPQGGPAARAYASLPERWQAVLWYREVEHLPVEQTARLLGLSPDGVTDLDHRARERLREAFLHEHVAGSPTPSCLPIALLDAHVHGRLHRRETAQVRDHLESCAHCRATVDQLRESDDRLGGVLAPLVLGMAGLGALTTVLPVGAVQPGAGPAAGAGAAAGAAEVGGGATGVGAGYAGAAGLGAAGTAGAGAGAGVAAVGADEAAGAQAGSAAVEATAPPDAMTEVFGAATVEDGAGGALAGDTSAAASGASASASAVPAGVVAAATAGVVALALAVAGVLDDDPDDDAPPVAEQSLEPSDESGTTEPAGPGTQAPDEPAAEADVVPEVEPAPEVAPAPEPEPDVDPPPAPVVTPAVQPMPIVSRQPLLDRQRPAPTPARTAPAAGAPGTPATDMPGTGGPGTGAPPSGAPSDPAPGIALPDPATPEAPPSTPPALAVSFAGGAVTVVAGAAREVPVAVVNSGGTPMSDLRATVTVPPGVEVTAVGGGWELCGGALGGSADLCRADLPAGGSAPLSMSVRVVDPAAVAPGAVIAVTLSAASVAPVDVVVPVRVADATPEVTLVVPAGVRLVVGEQATLSVAVANAGAVPARGVTAAVTLPSGVRWVSTGGAAPWLCRADGGSVVCSVEQLPAAVGDVPGVVPLDLALAADAAAVGLPDLGITVTVTDGTGATRSATTGVQVVAATPPDGGPVVPDPGGAPGVPALPGPDPDPVPVPVPPAVPAPEPSPEPEPLPEPVPEPVPLPDPGGAGPDPAEVPVPHDAGGVITPGATPLAVDGGALMTGTRLPMIEEEAVPAPQAPEPVSRPGEVLSVGGDALPAV